jgi:hypothetical protein
MSVVILHTARTTQERSSSRGLLFGVKAPTPQRVPVGMALAAAPGVETVTASDIFGARRNVE